MTLVDLFHFIDRHIDSVVWMIMALAAYSGSKEWLQYLRSNEYARLAIDLGFNAAEKFKRDNPTRTGEAGSIALETARKLWERLKVAPPANFDALATAALDTRHQQETRTGVPSGTASDLVGLPTATAIPAPVPPLTTKLQP